jgi:hypothetical protein
MSAFGEKDGYLAGMARCALAGGVSHWVEIARFSRSACIATLVFDETASRPIMLELVELPQRSQM